MSTAGDLSIASRANVAAEVSAGGRLHVGESATVDADATAGRSAQLDAGARVSGALRVGGDTLWGVGAAAGSARLMGQLVTDGGLVRARSVTAKGGIRSVPPGHAEAGA